MKCSGILRASVLLVLLAFTFGCSDDEEKLSPEGNGGTTTVGGANAGGASNRGGTSSQGGNTNAGTSSATGGVAASATAGAAGSFGGAAAGTNNAGSPSTGGTGAAAGKAALAGTAGIGATGGSTDVAGAAGAAGSTAAALYMNFIKQAAGTTTASKTGGTITVNSTYGSSGNAFKWVTPSNYYGTNSNGFIALSQSMPGDFSVSAEVTVTAQNKNNTACGIGLGMTTGFNPTDPYAYLLMRNSSTSTTSPGATATAYVSAATNVSMGSTPNVAWTNNSPMQLTFARAGNNVTVGVGTVGATPTTSTVPLGSLTNGTTAYGSAAVYPAVSFNNVAATITKLVVKDATGATVYDSETGSLVAYVPASLGLSTATTAMKVGATASVTATAVAVGGAVTGVTAVAQDPTVVAVSVTNGATNSTIGLTGLKGGVTTVTITNPGDTNALTNTKTLTVAVNDFPTADNYGTLATEAYPPPGATNAYADGALALTFDSPPTLNAGGSIKLLRLSDGVEVDSIAFAGETQLFGTTNINVGSQLVRVAGNTLYVTPHLGKLAYGTGYYVAIPTTSITGALNGSAFNGLSDANSVATWRFTTRAAPTLDPTNVTVDGAASSTADFRTIQGALDAVRAITTPPSTVTIHVAAGTYDELVRYNGPGLSQTIRIVGPAGNTLGDDCVVQWRNGNSMNGSTHTRATFYVTGANLVLENVTLKNTGLRAEVAQAETLYFASGAGSVLAAYNSSFDSNQDTVQTSGRNWFYKCRIEGNVDFIWGTADAALFENCQLRVVAESTTAASYSLFVARTGALLGTGSGTVGKGYVLLNSTVTVDPNVTAYFGRNAGAGAYYDQVALVNVTFAGSGAIGTGLWNTATAPTALGDASYVGWKSSNVSGLNLAALTTATGTSASIAGLSTEYDTRDHILNRVVTVTGGTPMGYQAAATIWDTASLATLWGAP